MDAVVDELARDALARLRALPGGQRLLVGISGFPASGKSTLAREVAARVNALAGPDGQEEVAVVVGLDGWHLSRAQLDAMPDPALARARRGAHWTFDGDAFVSFVQSLLDPAAGEVRAPSFDHALKDPVPDDVAVRAAHRLVLLEGLYVFLDIAPWASAGALLAERWYVDVPEPEAARRLVRRHVQSGIAPDEASARRRAEENDLPNGRLVREHLLHPTRYITSVTDPRFD